VDQIMAEMAVNSARFVAGIYSTPLSR